MRLTSTLEKIVDWYAGTAYGRWEGGDRLPFYCDPQRVGTFAVDPSRLSAGDDATLFKLLVTFALYQSRRDVDIMTLQRSMPARSSVDLVDIERVGRLVERCRCELVADASTFDRDCSVRRRLDVGRAACDFRPRTPCHVKDASLSIRRMGDMGKIPTSAFLHLREAGGFAALRARVVEEQSTPNARALVLVERLARSHRIGVKLATMFVSALSTPELAPGFAPWSPSVSGSSLVIVDANVGVAIWILSRGALRTYDERAAWFRRLASRIDLRPFRRGWPRSSPRLVQQAVYLFRSRSNRVAYGDPCAERTTPCEACVKEVCPFITKRPIVDAKIRSEKRPG